MSAPFHIGTSGWHYEHWRGPFYPEDSSARDFLPFYCRRFDTVEINNTFYQLPEEGVLQGWRDTVSETFLFSVKASRYITHRKKLREPEQTLSRFLNRLEALGGKAGPVLFQLPPRWRSNPERFEQFLRALPEGRRYAFEFRDPSWFAAGIYRALAEHRAAFCIYDLDGKLSPKEVTADFVYLRLHGPDGPYRGRYGERALSGWAGAFRSWARQGKEVFCYFDNDEAGYAVQDALALRQMLEG